MNGQRFIVREREKLFSTWLHFEMPREIAKNGPAIALLYPTFSFNSQYCADLSFNTYSTLKKTMKYLYLVYVIRQYCTNYRVVIGTMVDSMQQSFHFKAELLIQCSPQALLAYRPDTPSLLQTYWPISLSINCKRIGRYPLVSVDPGSILWIFFFFFLSSFFSPSLFQLDGTYQIPLYSYPLFLFFPLWLYFFPFLSSSNFPLAFLLFSFSYSFPIPFLLLVSFFLPLSAAFLSLFLPFLHFSHCLALMPAPPLHYSFKKSWEEHCNSNGFVAKTRLFRS